MKTADNDNDGLERDDRSAAMDLVRRMTEAGDAGLTTVQGMGRASVARFQHVACALEIDGLAIVRRSADGWPVGAVLTDFGSHVGRRLAAGDVALLPACGGLKVVEAPKRVRRLEAAGALHYPNAGEPPVLVLAEAPDHYDEDTVAGSATHVIIDPLASWIDHPALKLCSRRPEPAKRAWEVFSLEGLSFGLILETAKEFLGIDAHGSTCSESSLPETAWQVRVNC